VVWDQWSETWSFWVLWDNLVVPENWKYHKVGPTFCCVNLFVLFFSVSSSNSQLSSWPIDNNSTYYGKCTTFRTLKTNSCLNESLIPLNHNLWYIAYYFAGAYRDTTPAQTFPGNRIVTSQAYKFRCVESYIQDSCLPILGKPVSDWSLFCLDWCPAFISEATVKTFNEWGW
jgi:hypothetical protein